MVKPNLYILNLSDTSVMADLAAFISTPSGFVLFLLGACSILGLLFLVWDGRQTKAQRQAREDEAEKEALLKKVATDYRDQRLRLVRGGR